MHGATLFLAPLLTGIGASSEARADATCFCVLSTDNISGRGTPLGFHVDLTSQVNTSYSGIWQQHEVNQVHCAKICRAQVVAHTSNPSNAAPFCAANFEYGRALGGFSKVGTKDYRPAADSTKSPSHFIAYLLHIPQWFYKTYTCPPTWLSNVTNVAGGQSSDGRCKKLAGTLTISPPPNGTQLGSWGFSWLNQMWAYGTAANGGLQPSRRCWGETCNAASSCSVGIVDPGSPAYAGRMKLSAAAFAGLFLLAACTSPGTGPGEAVPQEAAWREIATHADRERLREWRSAWLKALAKARAAGHGGAIAAEGALLVPDGALEGAAPPAGAYRCRVIKVGAKGEGLLDYVAYPAFRCRIGAGAGAGDGVRDFEKLTGSQRPIGRLFAENDRRMIFLGTLQLGDERGTLRYGHDVERAMAGVLERIGDRRWRLVFPYPHYESLLDVLELVPEG
jgi:hypothetical protein